MSLFWAQGLRRSARISSGGWGMGKRMVSRRHVLRGAGAALGAGWLARPGSARAALPIKLSLNAPFDGSNAAFFLAEQQGYFRAEGLDIARDASQGSGEAITRVGS